MAINTLTGIFVAIAIVGVALSVVYLLSLHKRCSTLFSLDSKISRVNSIDGLRGYLATGVIISHGLSYRVYNEAGIWDWPRERLFQFSAQCSVAVFFAITGYLFWSMSFSRKLTPIAFYVKRFWRIYPLYVALTLTTVLLCFFFGTKSATSSNTLKDLLIMLIPGYHVWRPFCGISLGIFMTQTWSLLFEIGFYLAIPFLCPIAKRTTLSCVMLGSVYLVTTLCGAGEGRPSLLWIQFFLVGMVAAHIRKWDVATQMQSRLVSCLAALALVAMFSLPNIYQPVSVPLLLLFFVPIAFGNSMFGLFSWKPSLLLGEISYSLYMTHLVILYLMLKFLTTAVMPLESVSEVGYWFFLSVAMGVITFASVFCYVILEKPFLKGMPRAVLRARPERSPAHTFL